MENGLPAVPGFRSLSQAGIQLKEGERLETAAIPTGVASQVRSSSEEDPEWPPLPTMAQKLGDAAPDPRRGHTVTVQPREPGTKRPLPHQQHREQQAQLQPNSIPNGLYVGQLPTLQFACPCCGVVLTITDPKAYNGQPGPCPHCAAVVLPPRIVSPFAMATPPEASSSNGRNVRHYSGFAL